MFAKTQAKIILRYYEQTLSNFSITLYLRKSPKTNIISHYLAQWVCGQISENIFFFLDLLVQKLFFDKKQLIPAPLYLKSISLLLASATLLYLSTIPSCMSAVGEETSEPETSYCLRWKLFCYSSPSHLTPVTFLSPFALCICFDLFVFVFWLIEITTANLQGLIHSNPSKSTN